MLYIPGLRKLHPNIVKHMVECVGEKDIPATVLDELFKTNFADEDDGCTACIRFLKANNISDKIINKVISKAVSEIYSLSNPYLVVAKYVHTSRVGKEIYRRINKFNNNRNRTYNLEYILIEFEKFVSASPTSRYDFSLNKLFGYLIHTYKYFERSVKGQQVILTEINARGTQVKGADGEISLAQLQSVTEDKSKYTMDFPKVVRDIYEASQALFTVSNIVIYDLFSDFMNTELQGLEVDVSNIFRDAFSSSEIGPIVTSAEIISNTDTDFGRNTVKRRIKMLEIISKTVSNSIEFEGVKDLFQIALEMDARNLSSGNIGKLFKHKGRPSDLQYNYTTFFKILKGVVSLNEFKKYLKINKIQLSIDDYKLFRKPLFYKRFNTLEDYLSLKDITSEVISEGETIVDNVPYLTNDECYDAIGNRSEYDLVALSSLVKSEMDKNLSDSHNLPAYIHSIRTMLEYCQVVYNPLMQVYNVCVDSGIDPFSSEVLNYYYEVLPNLDEYLKDLIYPKDELMRERVLESKNLLYAFRFINLRIAYYSHILYILEMADKDTEYVILTMDKRILSFPKFISSIEDASKLITPYPLTFYTFDGSNISKNTELKKQYYLMSYSIYSENSKLYNFIEDWIDTITKSSLEYGITLVSKKLPKELQEKAVILEMMEPITTNEFEIFKSKYVIRGGFLFDKGELLVHNRCYVHEKGYFFWIDNNYEMIELKLDQRF